MTQTSNVNHPARILIVDDDALVLSGMREILLLEDYHVITATNGVEGLQALEAHPDAPDLIIANVLMPKMDGLTFIREMQKKRQHKRIPFIIESASPRYKAEAIELGAAFYFLVPYNAEELLEAVANALAAK